MMVRPFAEQGYFTQVHNLLYDIIMPIASGSEWKVLSFVLRRTKGKRRKNAALSYAEIKAGTGIKSDTTVGNALHELTRGEENGESSKFGAPILLARDAGERGASRREATRYALNPEYSLKVYWNETEDGDGVFALQKMESESTAPRTPKNGEPSKIGTPKNGVSRTPENGERKTPHIESEVSTKKNSSSEETYEESTETSTLGREYARAQSKNIPNSSNSQPQNSREMFDMNGGDDARYHTDHYLTLLEVCDLEDATLQLDPRRRALTAGIAVQLAESYTPNQFRRARANWPYETAPTPRQFAVEIKKLLNRRDVKPNEPKQTVPARVANDDAAVRRFLTRQTK